MALLSSEAPVFVGVLEGHTDWVTAIRTPPLEGDGVIDQSNVVVSTSRDKQVMVWRVDQHLDRFVVDNENLGQRHLAGIPVRSLRGHSEPIEDLSLSLNGKFALTGSWDNTLRLWDLESGRTLRRFVGHKHDVTSVALSPDNRQIVSGSRDKTIKLWNTMAECKFTITEDQHTDWVSCVRFSPSAKEPLIVSCGWDKVVKVWDLQNCSLKTNLVGHTSALQTVTISPDGSLCASGGKDGVAMLWDVNEGKHLYSLESNSNINCLCFSPCNYWLCAATDTSVKIWNLEDKKILAELTRPVLYFEDDKTKKKDSKRPSRTEGVPWCTTLTWSADGQTLFAGATDGRIYVYKVPGS